MRRILIWHFLEFDPILCATTQVTSRIWQQGASLFDVPPAGHAVITAGYPFSLMHYFWQILYVLSYSIPFDEKYFKEVLHNQTLA